MPNIQELLLLEHGDVESLLEEVATGMDAADMTWRTEQAALLNWTIRLHFEAEMRFLSLLPASPWRSRLVNRSLEDRLILRDLMDNMHAAGVDDRNWRDCFNHVRSALELHILESEQSFAVTCRSSDDSDSLHLISRLLRCVRTHADAREGRRQADAGEAVNTQGGQSSPGAAAELAISAIGGRGRAVSRY